MLDCDLASLPGLGDVDLADNQLLPSLEAPVLSVASGMDALVGVAQPDQQQHQQHQQGYLADNLFSYGTSDSSWAPEETWDSPPPSPELLLAGTAHHHQHLLLSTSLGSHMPEQPNHPESPFLSLASPTSDASLWSGQLINSKAVAVAVNMPLATDTADVWTPPPSPERLDDLKLQPSEFSAPSTPLILPFSSDDEGCDIIDGELPPMLFQHSDAAASLYNTQPGQKRSCEMMLDLDDNINYHQQLLASPPPPASKANKRRRQQPMVLQQQQQQQQQQPVQPVQPVQQQQQPTVHRTRSKPKRQAAQRRRSYASHYASDVDDTDDLSVSSDISPVSLPSPLHPLHQHHQHQQPQGQFEYLPDDEDYQPTSPYYESMGGYNKRSRRPSARAAAAAAASTWSSIVPHPTGPHRKMEKARAAALSCKDDAPMREAVAALDAVRNTGEIKEIKRLSHNILERKRRNELKDAYTLLRSELPHLSETLRAPTSQILQQAVQFVHKLRQECKSQERQLVTLRANNSKLKMRIKNASKRCMAPSTLSTSGRSICA